MAKKNKKLAMNMERKIIALNKGIRRNPTVGADGELADCVNLMVKNGEIVNAGVMKEVGSMQNDSQTLLYLHHSTTGEEWYIVREYSEDGESTSIGAFKDTTHVTIVESLETGDSVREVTSMGNILIVSTQKNIYYSVLKENGYVLLGNHIPELELNFGLETEISQDLPTYSGQRYLASFINLVKSNLSTYAEFYIAGDNTSEIESNITDYQTTVKALLGELLDKAKSNNKFTQPFLVRYALKLYDGTYTMPSAPILMVPTSGLNPIIGWYGTETFSTFQTVEPVPYMALSTLKMKCKNSDAFADWKDIVKGVGIFISAPFMKYDQSNNKWCKDDVLQRVTGESGGVQRPIVGMRYKNQKYKDYYDDFYNDDPRLQYGIGKQEGSTVYAKHKNTMHYTSSSHADDDLLYMPLPYKSNEQILKDVAECADFYKLADYSIDAIPTEMTDVSIADNALENLTTLERLEDDTLSRFSIHPKVMQVFNGRLHMGNITKNQISGFDPSSMICYTDGCIHDSGTEEKKTIELSIEVYLNKNSKISKVTSKTTRADYYLCNHPKYIYYPDSSAYMCRLIYKHDDGTVESTWLKMKSHAFLGGSLAFTDIMNSYEEGISDGTPVDPSTINGDGSEVMQNKIYSSEVYNPFKIDDTQAKTAGNGEILAITSNVKALSQGQFGQFPMIAFTSEGIWTMEVDSEGKYSSSRPLLRDVIIRGTKPLQTDSVILYMTSRGIMMLSGSESRCISKGLEGLAYSTSGNLRAINELMNANSEMLYDYDNGAIRLFSTYILYSYIMDLETGEWSRSEDTIPDAIVMGYPRSIMQYNEKQLEYVKQLDTTTIREGTLLTRETAFGDPLTRKSLMDLRVMRKNAKNADGTLTAKVAVWASNDRQNWTQIKTLKGRSWIWYRFAVYTNMTDVDGIEGIVCDIATRNEAGRMR